MKVKFYAKICENEACSKAFRVTPSELFRRYCSRTCAAAVGGKKRIGQPAPKSTRKAEGGRVGKPRSERVERVCPTCQRVMLRTLADPAVHCSAKCAALNPAVRKRRLRGVVAGRKARTQAG